MTPNQLTPLFEGLEAPGDTVIDLLAHKLPALNILEISIDAENVAIYTLWFQRGKDADKVAYTQCDFVSMNSQGNVPLQEANKA